MSWRSQSVFVLLWATCASWGLLNAQTPTAQQTLRPQHKIALLTNGRSISYEHRKNMGAYTRLYTREGYMEIPTAAIRGFKNEDRIQAATETPVMPATKTAVTASAPAPNPAKAEWKLAGYKVNSLWALTGVGALLGLSSLVFLFTRKRGAAILSSSAASIN